MHDLSVLFRVGAAGVLEYIPDSSTACHVYIIQRHQHTLHQCGRKLEYWQKPKQSGLKPLPCCYYGHSHQQFTNLENLFFILTDE